MNRIDGVRFEGAWPLRIWVRLQTVAGPIAVFYMDARSLLTNKKAAARPKDLEDAAYLRARVSSRTPRKRST